MNEILIGGSVLAMLAVQAAGLFAIVYGAARLAIRHERQR